MLIMPRPWPLTFAQLRVFFEKSSTGYSLATLDGAIVNTNPALCKMLGYHQQELLTMSLVDCTEANYVTADQELFQKLLTGKIDSYEVEKLYKHKDGRQVWGRVTVLLYRDSSGQPEIVASIIEDITKQKELERDLRGRCEAAEANSHAKSEFLANMSHELRSPLNTISGFSQSLDQGVVGLLSEGQKNYVQRINITCQHMLALIDELLDLSRIEAGQEELGRVELSVQELCDECINNVRHSAESNNLQLLLQIDPNVNNCIADARRFQQMLLNLLTNAIKFTPKGQVRLSVEKVPLGMEFKVSDTGIGIDSSKLKVLFEPYRRLNSLSNHQSKGTGLGLAITRKLAQLHGGDVTVKSTLGKGSEFTVFLPDDSQERVPVVSAFSASRLSSEQTETEESDLPESTSEQKISTSKRILLMEGDQRHASSLEGALNRAGYQVKYIQQPNSFLETVRSFNPSLIVLGVMLPNRVKGYDLLEALRQTPEGREIPAVIVTPKEMTGERNRFFAAGANHYVGKPIGIAQIEPILRQYLS